MTSLSFALGVSAVAMLFCHGAHAADEMALLLPASVEDTTVASEAINSGNLINVTQGGKNNSLSLDQGGTANTLLVSQLGNGGTILVVQTGHGNRATIVQR